MSKTPPNLPLVHALDPHTSTDSRFRVSRTPGALYGDPQRARKRRRCDGHLANPHWIEVGDLIIWSALPPDHPDIGNPGWWHHGFCADCAPEHTVREVVNPVNIDLDCPACGRTNQAHRDPDGVAPSDGDWSVCWACGVVGVFVGSPPTKIRRPTLAETREIAEDPNIQRALQAMSQHPTPSAALKAQEKRP